MLANGLGLLMIPPPDNQKLVEETQKLPPRPSGSPPRRQ